MLKVGEVAHDRIATTGASTYNENESLEDLKIDSEDLLVFMYRYLGKEADESVNWVEIQRFIHQNPSCISFLSNVKFVAAQASQSHLHRMMAAEEKKQIRDLIKDVKLHENEDVYILSSKWWNLWCDYVGFHEENEGDDSDMPGPVDNSDIIDKSKVDVLAVFSFPLLHDNIIFGSDYIAVTEKIWITFLSWYGGGNGAGISRHVRKESKPYPRPSLSFQNKNQAVKDLSKRQAPISFAEPGLYVDLYPVFLNLGLLKEQEIASYCIVSTDESCNNLKVLACKQLELENVDMYKLWRATYDQEPTIIDGENLTVAEAGITFGNSILLGVRKRQSTFGTLTSWFSKKMQSDSHINPDTLGHIGLHNLGNTCYLNSALQCLAHTSPLVHYFRESAIENKESFIGTFAAFIKQYWASRFLGSLSPTSIRAALIKSSSQFNDNEQHDGQEALGLILDLLHMELNEGDKKFNKENPDFNGHEDSTLAAIYWKNHLKRDLSLIVSLFEGQFKSHTQCVECRHEIVKFHPYLFLSLQLPNLTSRIINVTLICDSELPRSFSVEVDRRGKVADLTAALKSMLTNSSLKHILLADVQSNYIFSFLRRSTPLESIKDRYTIYAYLFDRPELSVSKSCLSLISNNELENSESNDSEPVRIVLLSRKTKKEWTRFRSQFTDVLIAKPMIIHVAANITGANLYQAVKNTYEKVFGLQWKGQNPFSLKYVGRNGLECSRCLQEDFTSSYLKCTGCIVSNNDDEELKLRNNEFIAVHWVKTEELSLESIETQLEKMSPTADTSENTSANSEKLSLAQIILDYEKPEYIPSTDFKCPKCPSSTTASGIRRETIFRAPPILMIQFKRFIYSNGGFIKNSTMIEIPVDRFDLETFFTESAEGEYKSLIDYLPHIQNDTLRTSVNSVNNHGKKILVKPKKNDVTDATESRNLTKSETNLPKPKEKPRKASKVTPIDSDSQYELYAVLSHIGDYYDGHYIVYIRDFVQQKWYIYNDNVVKEAKWFPVTGTTISDDAYVLFYRQKSVRNRSWQYYLKQLREELKRIESTHTDQ